MSKIRYLAVAVAVAFALGLVAAPGPVATAATENPDCWGAATAVFARMGEMGAHTSAQEEPRLGLANLARYLYEQPEPVISEPTLSALGAFVAEAYGLSVAACE